MHKVGPEQLSGSEEVGVKAPTHFFPPLPILFNQNARIQRNKVQTSQTKQNKTS